MDDEAEAQRPLGVEPRGADLTCPMCHGAGQITVLAGKEVGAVTPTQRPCPMGCEQPKTPLPLVGREVTLRRSDLRGGRHAGDDYTTPLDVQGSPRTEEETLDFLRDFYGFDQD